MNLVALPMRDIMDRKCQRHMCSTLLRAGFVELIHETTTSENARRKMPECRQSSRRYFSDLCGMKVVSMKLCARDSSVRKRLLCTCYAIKSSPGALTSKKTYQPIADIRPSERNTPSIKILVAICKCNNSHMMWPLFSTSFSAALTKRACPQCCTFPTMTDSMASGPHSRATHLPWNKGQTY